MACLPARSVSFAALLLSIAAFASAESNVRPHFSMGPTIPVRWGSTDAGQMLSAGIEVEQSRRVSTLATFAAHMMSAQHLGTGTVYSLELGARVHMAQNSRVRPYVQAGFGARLNNVIDTYWYPNPADASGSGVPSRQSVGYGPTGWAGIGVTTAGYHGAGLFIDASFEADLLNPRDYALAPFRIGLTLP